MPNKKVLAQKEKFHLVDFSENILEKALNSPTNDFEDNIQLHSAAHAECDYFLTGDRKLTNLKFFGKSQITPNLISKD